MEFYKPSVFLAALLVFCTAKTDGEEASQIEVGDILNRLVLTAFESGEPLPLTDFAGKILYLEWFYWW